MTQDPDSPDRSSESDAEPPLPPVPPTPPTPPTPEPPPTPQTPVPPVLPTPPMPDQSTTPFGSDQAGPLPAGDPYVGESGGVPPTGPTVPGPTGPPLPGPPPGSGGYPYAGPDPRLVPNAPPPGSMNYVPPAGYGPGYAAAPVAKNDGMSIASLILGIVSVVLTCAPLFGIIPGALAIIFGVISRKNIARDGTKGEGMAKAGLILGIVGCALSAAWFIFIVVVGSTSPSSTYPY